MTSTLRRLLDKFEDDPYAVSDYVRNEGIDLSKTDRKHLERMMGHD